MKRSLLLFLSTFFIVGIVNSAELTPGYVPKTNAGGTAPKIEDSTIWADGSNVGIGTTDPQFDLDVSGNINASNAITINNIDVCLSDGSNCPGVSNGWDDVGANVYLIDINDNVGIGTINPSGKLHVAGGNLVVEGSFSGMLLDNQMKIDGNTSRKITISQTNGTYDEDIRFDIDTTANTWAIDSTTGVVVLSAPDMEFKTGGLYSDTVLNVGASYSGSQTPPTSGAIIQGNVGIGTFNPSTPLQVVGTVTATAFVGDGSGLTGVSGGGSIGIGTANTITFWPTTTTIGSLPTATYPSLTELSYVKDVTSAIQTQLNAKDAVTTAGDFITRTSNDFDVDALDEDNMASDSAVHLATQQSIKAYVDTAISGVSGGAGGWTDGGTNVYTTTTTDNVGIGTTTPTAVLLVENAGTQDSFRVNDSVVDGSPFIITSNGNVGIGTISPTVLFSVGSSEPFQVNSLGKLAISHNQGNTIVSTSAGNSAIAITANNQTSASSLAVSSSSSGLTASIGALTYSGTGTGNVLTLTNSGASSGSALSISQSNASSTGRSAVISNLGTSDSLYVTDESSDPTPFVISSVGNVGIGTTTASTKFHVVGGARVTGLVSCDTIDTDADGLMSCGTDDSSGASAWVDGGTNVYVSPTTDNVAIGTTTPTQKLTVVGTVSATAFVGDGSGLTGVGASGWTDSGTLIYPTTTTDAVGIGTHTAISGAILTVKGTIAGSGTGPIAFTDANVGIGTTTAGALLTVGSTGQTTVTSAGVVSVPDDAYAAGWNGATAVPTKNAVYDKIETLGAGYWTDAGVFTYLTTTTDNVGIGTVAPDQRLKVEGSSAANISTMVRNSNSSGVASVKVWNSANLGFEMVATGSGYAVPSTYGVLATAGESLSFGESDGTINMRINPAGTVRFAPTDTPDTCNAGNEGSLYYDNSLNEFCDCDGSSWAQVDGGGAC